MASGSEARRFLDGFGRGGAGVFDGPPAMTSRGGSGDVWGLEAWGLGATTSFGFTFPAEGADLSFLKLTARKIPAIRIAAAIDA